MYLSSKIIIRGIIVLSARIVSIAVTIHDFQAV